jgi:hypothetical protein
VTDLVAAKITTAPRQAAIRRALLGHRTRRRVDDLRYEEKRA